MVIIRNSPVLKDLIAVAVCSIFPNPRNIFVLGFYPSRSFGGKFG